MNINTIQTTGTIETIGDIQHYDLTYTVPFFDVLTWAILFIFMLLGFYFLINLILKK
jgi:hypothetical protein